jgi:hypothetical protein
MKWEVCFLVRPPESDGADLAERISMYLTGICGAEKEP